LRGWLKFSLWEFGRFFGEGLFGGGIGGFGLRVYFLFDLYFFVELPDHLNDGDKIGLGLPSGFIDGPADPFNKVLVFA
jgi:hypothetical protein